MKTPILGSSYVARSVNAAANRMVNLFPEVVAEGGKEPSFLSRAPGLALLQTIGTGPIRGLWVMGSYLYVVSGSILYKVDNSYTATNLNLTSINSLFMIAGSGPVSMADDGNQLVIAANGPLYIYNFTVNEVEEFGGIFPGAVTVAFIDNYFVFNEPNSQNIWILEPPGSLSDTSSFDSTEVGTAEGSPDGTIGLIVSNREVWIFGSESTEVWYDQGNSSGFPLSPIQGAFNEIGCASPYTIAKMDNSVFWLSTDARGHGIVYRAKGYNGERISTHAVEWQIQQYGNLSNAIAYTYQQDGHSFYVLVFPDQNTTWVYDAATQAWHERCGLVDGVFTRHRGNCQAFFNNVNVIGDFENGNIYSFDLFTYDDNGSPQKWLRSWRAIGPGQNNLTRSAHHTLQLDCETGVGLNAGQGSDPQVMLQWSDDGGHTWSNEHWTSMGAIGAYGTRTIWRRLGMTDKIRDRVYQVSGTDPVKIAIMGAELHSSMTSA